MVCAYRSISEAQARLLQALAEARYWSKRAAGIPAMRSDGSECSIENDRHSIGAEYFAATECGVPFNPTIAPRGDGGFDFKLSLDVEAIWLGRVGNEPRQEGHLLVNPHEPQRFGDIYIVVGGDMEQGYRFEGWTTHKRLIQNPLGDFRHGERYQMPIGDLYDIDKLLRLKRR